MMIVNRILNVYLLYDKQLSLPWFKFPVRLCERKKTSMAAINLSRCCVNAFSDKFQAANGWGGGARHVYTPLTRFL